MNVLEVRKLDIIVLVWCYLGLGSEICQWYGMFMDNMSVSVNILGFILTM